MLENMEVFIPTSSKYPQFIFKRLWRLILELNSDFEFWNFTYAMPSGFVGTPNLNLAVELW